MARCPTPRWATWTCWHPGMWHRERTHSMRYGTFGNKLRVWTCLTRLIGDRSVIELGALVWGEEANVIVANLVPVSARASRFLFTLNVSPVTHATRLDKFHLNTLTCTELLNVLWRPLCHLQRCWQQCQTLRCINKQKWCHQTSKVASSQTNMVTTPNLVNLWFSNLHYLMFVMWPGRDWHTGDIWDKCNYMSKQLRLVQTGWGS